MTRHLSLFLSFAQKKPYSVTVAFTCRKSSSGTTLTFTSNPPALFSGGSFDS